MRSASRWIYVAVGCVVLLFSGLVYAWSVLSGPIAAEFPHWSTAQLSLTFTIVMSFFCLGGLTCGALSARISPRIFLWISALLFLAGFLLGGMAYGGVTPANAAFVSSYYGMRHYAVNLSVVVTNLLFASFGSTIAGALYDATGSYLSTDAMILVLAVLSAAVSFGIDLCDRRMLKRR